MSTTVLRSVWFSGSPVRVSRGAGRPEGGRGARGWGTPRGRVPCSRSRSGSRTPRTCWRRGPRSRPRSRAAPPAGRTSCRRGSPRSGGSRSVRSSWHQISAPTMEETKDRLGERARWPVSREETKDRLGEGHPSHHLSHRWLHPPRERSTLTLEAGVSFQ